MFGLMGGRGESCLFELLQFFVLIKCQVTKEPAPAFHSQKAVAAISVAEITTASTPSLLEKGR